MVKIVSWNVNGLRAAHRKGGLEALRALRADVVCLQEVRAQPADIGRIADAVLPEYPYRSLHPAERKGYSGTAVFSRRRPRSVTIGMGLPGFQDDREGRVITVEFPAFRLVNVYTPNSQRGLLRLDYRARWDRAFLRFLRTLAEDKGVVFCGDLNVAHEEIDLARPASNRMNAGFTDRERAGFSRILAEGFLDSFRSLHPGEGGHYSWWSQHSRARERNVGWRIDYFCLSRGLEPLLRDAFILPRIEGSDHCPVGIVLSDPPRRGAGLGSRQTRPSNALR